MRPARPRHRSWGQLLQGGAVSPVAQGLGPLRDHVGPACGGAWVERVTAAGWAWAGIVPMRGRLVRLRAALGAQRQRKQLIAKVDAQVAERAVAVGFDGGQAQA